MVDFKVIIAGTRDFNNYDLLAAHADKMLSIKKLDHRIVIISGGARGADKLGERYARERGYDLEVYPAKWEEYGKKAGYLRNRQMANNANALIAFWDGKSRGTNHMINTAKYLNLQVSVVLYV